MDEKICAVVVTYNRKKLLLECLESLRKQTRALDGIYIIDNASTDGTPELLRENGYIKGLPPSDLKEPWEKEFCINSLIDDKPITIHYVRMDKNSGGAGGFYEGVKRGYEKGYDWLWLMDDDVEVEKNCLKTLLEVETTSLIKVPLVIGGEDRIQYYHHKRINRFLLTEKSAIPFRYLKEVDRTKDVFLIDANAFLGLLISRKVVEKIGLPIRSFFIWCDDLEYTYRARLNNYSIVLVLKAYVYHKDGNYCWDRKKLFYSNSWKIYYFAKNRIFIARKYGSFLTVFYWILRILFSVLNHKSFVVFRIKMKGLIHGLFEKSSRIF